MIQRQYMGNMLIGANHHHATALPVNAAHIKNIAMAVVGTEGFFIIGQPVATFAGLQQCGHLIDLQFAMVLLENGAHIDGGIHIGALCCVFDQR